jgi:chaperone required for assembly of F1-ATPase
MKMKRFYKTATIAPEGEGYTVQLDGRSMKTPAGNALILPTPALADAVAEEWRGQGDTINLEKMPFTKSANTAIERVRPQRAEVTEELLRYGSGDLLCYRAEDPKLAERQRQHWDPVLDWLATRHNARLSLTEGVVHIDQPGDAVVALGRALAPLNDYVLTGVYLVTTLTGSLALALALQDAHLDTGTAFDKAHLDERYQREKWGADAEADKRLASLQQELETAAKFMNLARV